MRPFQSALLFLAAWGLAANGAAPAPLTLENANLLSASDSSTVVTAPDCGLQGSQLGAAPAATAEACAAACTARPECHWANYCALQEGCSDGNGTLDYHQCRLLRPTSTGAVQPMALCHAGSVTTTAVFALSAQPDTFPGFSTLAGQGLQGADFDCPGSLLPGVCAFSSVFDAVSICIWLKDCRSVTVYANGTDGVSGPVALLKSSALSPDSSFLAPSVYTLQQREAFPLVALYLHPGEANVSVPTDLEHLPASAGGAEANSTLWLGCILADNSLMAGAVAGVMDGVPAAEDCCRICRDMEGGACNAWNWCPLAGGCSHQGRHSKVALQQFQCELRFQSLVVPKLGWPPALLDKGTDVPFVSGSPIVSVGPPVPGYTRHLGSGLFGQRGYTCEGSLRPEIQECVKSASLEDHARSCSGDPRCDAFVYKPAGVFNVFDSLQGGAIFKGSTDSSAIVLTPSSVLYVQDSQAPASLSPGAVAGICTGAVVLAGAVAGAALLSWRRLRQRSKSVVAGSPAKLEEASQEGASENAPPSKTAANECQPGSRGEPEEPAHACRSVAERSPSPSPSQSGGSARGSPQRSGATPGACTPWRAINTAAPTAASPFAGAAGQAFPAVVAASPFAADAGQAFPAAVAASPFAADAGQAFPATVAASPGAVSGGQAGVPRLTSRQPSPEGSGPDEPMPELLLMVQQQERQQESCGGSTLDVGALLRALPSSLPPELSDWVIDPAEVTLLTWPNGNFQELGKGASGTVFKAVYRGEVVAAKAIDLGRSVEAQQTFVREALRMQQARHPALISFFGVSLNGPRGIILLEYCEGRDLHNALQLRALRGSERAFGWYRRGRRVALDVARALNYLHSMGMVHMDVKSSNVLLTAGGAAKLGDVGLSRLQQRTYLSNVGAVGTFDWAAPEVLLGGTQCTASVDLYSFGVLMYEIITGEQPVRGHLRLPLVPAECPQDACDLMMQCMSVAPAARPTAQDAMQRLARMVRDSAHRREQE